MHFAITNDDGYDAMGLAVLARVAAGFGTTDVVAPMTPQSQTSHAISLNRTVSLRTLEHAELGTVFAVAGRPADCTRLALAALAGRGRPDWVLSGINHGANLGVDVYYSGTVAAAREAAILGVPAVAFSQFVRRPQPIDWQGAAVLADRALRHILQAGCPAGVFFNVNLPAVHDRFDQVPLVEAPVAVEGLPLDYQIADAPTDPQGVPEGCTHYRHSGRYVDRDRVADSDVDLAFADNITISRVKLQV